MNLRRCIGMITTPQAVTPPNNVVHAARGDRPRRRALLVVVAGRGGRSPLSSTAGSSRAALPLGLGQGGSLSSGCGTGSPTAGWPGWAGRRSRIRFRRRSFSGSGIGIADSSAWVYGCVGCSKTLADLADLHDPAQVHHRDPVGDVPDHREVVGDEQVGQAELGLELVQQVDHAGLDGDVERRHRLVEHEQLGLQRQRPGDADPLPLAAGELLRVAVGVVGSRPTSRSSSLTRSSIAFGLYWNTPSGSAMMSKTGIRGSSEAIGSWNTTCRSRRISLPVPRSQARRRHGRARRSGRRSAA